MLKLILRQKLCKLRECNSVREKDQQIKIFSKEIVDTIGYLTNRSNIMIGRSKKLKFVIVSDGNRPILRRDFLINLEFASHINIYNINKFVLKLIRNDRINKQSVIYFQFARPPLDYYCPLSQHILDCISNQCPIKKKELNNFQD